MDVSVSGDMMVSGGKDFKVKVWIVTELYFGGKQSPIAEFGEHTSEVTQVSFSKSMPGRAFSASHDKTFRVYDIFAKLTLKVIQAASPINKLAIDIIESQVYLACDNQNVYAYSLETSQVTSTAQGVTTSSEKHKRTLQHRKKVTAMCLTFDNQYLVSGDSQGLIYIWNIAAEHAGGS